MSKPSEQHQDREEVSRLLTAAILGDASEADVSRLNELLLGYQSLRHHAAQFLEEEAMLRREFEVLDRVVDFHNPLANDRSEKAIPSNTVAAGDIGHKEERRHLLFAAVAVVICALAATIWWEQWTRSPIVRHLTSRADSQALPLGQSDEGSRLRHRMPLAASMLSRVTYVSWAGPRFASEINAEPLTTTLQEGVIPFTSAFGRPAQGYMICLQPGSLLDLVVAADAEGENSLAVIEFEPNGTPTGRRLTFSNSAGQGKRGRDGSSKLIALTKKGRLGIWTERNDTANPRYYLFTAVHKLLNRSVDDSWHVSRLLPFVEEANLVHVGWDDSGMLSSGKQERIHVPDDDFDDVSATIRIRTPKTDPSRQAGAFVYSKTAAYDGPVRPALAGTARYAFSVAPGQVAIVKVCSRSGRPVELALFEKETNRVQWRCRKEGSRSPTLGVCAIENNTPEMQKYVLIGQMSATEAPTDSGAPSSSRRLSQTVLFDKEDLVTVVFDDGTMVSDFDRVKVDILTVSEL
jgi:hypothetical protein